MTIVAFWFVSEIGLRVQGTGNIPFVFYFTVGILPWFLSDNRHLITKMVFPSEVLPVINFLVESVPHLVLLLGMCFVLAFANLLAVDHMIWVIYFYACTACVALGASWVVAFVCVFSRDAAPAATLGVGLIFWVTPIMWRVETLPNSWRWAGFYPDFTDG